MTLKIVSDRLGSLGADGFAKLVDERIAVLREYDAHEAIVRGHAADPDMPAKDRWVTLAVPQSDLDAAISISANQDGTHTFAPDYEIVAPPPLPFEARKAALFNQVTGAEVEAINAVLPPGKMRAYQYREADIHKADQQRVAAEIEQRNKDHQSGAVIDPTPISHAELAAKNRPPADTQFLEEQEVRAAKRAEINRWAAGLHSDIEDLTEATIDAFEVKPFHAGA